MNLKKKKQRVLHPPEGGGERRDAAQEGEANDDEEKGEEDAHVVAGAPTLSCNGKPLFTPGCVTDDTATTRKHLKHNHRGKKLLYLPEKNCMSLMTFNNLNEGQQHKQMFNKISNFFLSIHSEALLKIK